QPVQLVGCTATSEARAEPIGILADRFEIQHDRARLAGPWALDLRLLLLGLLACWRSDRLLLRGGRRRLLRGLRRLLVHDRLALEDRAFLNDQRLAGDVAVDSAAPGELRAS